MAGILQTLGELRGRLEGGRESMRARILQPIIDEFDKKARERARDENQQAIGKAAAALNLNAPDIGALALLARADPLAASGLLSQAAQARTPQAARAAQLDQLQIEGQQGLNRINAIREKQAPVELSLTQQNLASAQQSYNHQRQQFPLIMQQARQALKVQEAQIAASNLTADAKKLTFFNTVRSQYQALPVIKKAAEAQGAYIAASQAALLPSALGAQLALTKMAKISDPESVVREGDIEVIREGYGLLSQLDRALRSSAGQGMTKEMYATYMDALDAMYGPAMDMAAVATNEYRQFETQYKARPGEFTNSVGLDWSLTPGLWKDAPPGQKGKVKKW